MKGSALVTASCSIQGPAGDLHNGSEEQLINVLSKLDRKSIERKVGLTDGNEADVASVWTGLDGDLKTFSAKSQAVFQTMTYGL